MKRLLVLILFLNLSCSFMQAAEKIIIPIAKVTSLLFVDNETILAGTDDQRLIKYYLPRQTIEKEINTDCPNYLRLDQTKDRCVGRGDYKSYKCVIFSTQSLDKLHELSLERESYWNFQSCSFSSLDKNVLFLSWIKAIERYDITTKQFTKIDYNPIVYNDGMALHPTKNILYVATARDDNGGLAIYDCDASPVKIKYIPFVQYSFPFSCISNADGSFVALADAYNKTNIVNTDNSQGYRVPNIGITKSLAFHPIKKNILAILTDDKIRLIYWDVEKNREVGEENFSDHTFNLKQWTENIAFSPDGQRMVVGLNEHCEVIKSME